MNKGLVLLAGLIVGFAAAFFLIPRLLYGNWMIDLRLQQYWALWSWRVVVVALIAGIGIYLIAKYARRTVG